MPGSICAVLKSPLGLSAVALEAIEAALEHRQIGEAGRAASLRC